MDTFLPVFRGMHRPGDQMCLNFHFQGGTAVMFDVLLDLANSPYLSTVI